MIDCVICGQTSGPVCAACRERAEIGGLLQAEVAAQMESDKAWRLFRESESDETDDITGDAAQAADKKLIEARRALDKKRDALRAALAKARGV